MHNMFKFCLVKDIQICLFYSLYIARVIPKIYFP